MLQKIAAALRNYKTRSPLNSDAIATDAKMGGARLSVFVAIVATAYVVQASFISYLALSAPTAGNLFNAAVGVVGGLLIAKVTARYAVDSKLVRSRVRARRPMFFG